MNDPTHPPSARRFASFLDRETCLWMSSPSLALLAALATGKGRPKRLLVQENAPVFVTNIGLIIGAAVVNVPAQDVDGLLKGILRTEGLRADQIWAVATHRDGKLSPTDWLSRCAAHGIPTIELCLGSLFELARWSPFPATFTIVDLDAEEVFAGARLAALLTGDRAVAARAEKLCLPASGGQEYVFDAMPRGLAHDEPVLAGLVERLIALGGEKPQAAWKGSWSARFVQAEQDAAALAESLKTIDELRRAVVRWEGLFQAAESEAAQDAELLTRTRADLLRLRSESEGTLASMQAERAGLSERLLRAERERDLAVSDASRRDESQRRIASELNERVIRLEAAAAASADREARQTASYEGEKARAKRLEAEVAVSEEARAGLSRQKTLAEQALASMRIEKESLARERATLEAELNEVRKEAVRLQADLDEQNRRTTRIERDAALLTAHEASRIREAGAVRAGLSARIKTLEETLRGETAKHRERADQLEREMEARDERASRAAEGWALERAELSERIARMEAAAAAADQERAELAAGKAEAERALESARSEWEAARLDGQMGLAQALDMEARVARLEADEALAERARTELMNRKQESDRALAAAQDERAVLIEKLSTAERERDEARAAAALARAGGAGGWLRGLAARLRGRPR